MGISEFSPVEMFTSLFLQRRTRPGLAMSQDGRNWARIEGEHHSGALFDVGEEAAWDAAFVAAPQVTTVLFPRSHWCRAAARGLNWGCPRCDGTPSLSARRRRVRCLRCNDKHGVWHSYYARVFQC